MTIQLRPYQSDLISRVYQSYHAGNRNVLAVLPTGGGKSVIVSQIILDGHLQGLSECVIAHRNELVGQMSMHVARRGIPHRIIASKQAVSQITAEHRRELGRSFVNPNAPCSVVSVDTLIARQDQLRAWAAQVQRWTIDEAHHATGNSARPQHINKWGKAIAMFPNAYGLGVTATPSRADGVGLGRWQSDGTDGDGPFDDMIIGPSMRDLIDIGALSDYEIAVPESDFQIDESLVAASGDWSTKRMREASKRSHIVGDVVVEYQRRALGKRAICFATDVETATEMATRFNESGITAAAVSAKTPTETRNEYIRRFRDGRITVLVNVDLFGEGFDVPAVEVVIMARPTASLAVYLQQCLDTETEILSQRGWLKREDVISQDVVAAYNTTDETIEWVGIDRIIDRKLGGESVFGISAPHLDIRVTAGHDMVVRGRSATCKKWIKQQASVVAQRKAMFQLPVSGNIKTPDACISDDEIRFIGWFLTDGTFNKTTRQISISQSASKDSHCAEIRRVLRSCGFGYGEYNIKRTGDYSHCADNIMFCVSEGKHPLRGKNKGLSGWTSLKSWLDKSIPSIFDTLSPRQFGVLMDAINLGDGQNNHSSLDWVKRTMTITTGDNRVMADRLQALAVVRGWRCNLSVQSGPGKDQYILQMRPSGYATIAGVNVPDGSVNNKKPYRRSRFEVVESSPNERFWCVENRLGTLVTRRKGKVAVVGNCGRALRPLDGKSHGLLIDHVSNWKRHSFPDKPHIWTLDRREKRSKREPDPDDIPLTACRECSRPYERVYNACPYCRHQPVPAGGGRSIDMVDGDLMLLDRDKLAELRAAMTLETPADVAARVTHVAGELAGRGAANRAIERHAAQAELIEAIEQWAGVRRAMGESDSVIQRRFYHATGCDILTAMGGKRSEMDALANVVRSWYM